MEKKPLCTKPWTRLYVTAEGKCFNCCYQIKPIHQIKSDSESFETVWNDKNIRFIRNVLLMGEMPYEFCDCLNKRGSIPPDDSEPTVPLKSEKDGVPGREIFSSSEFIKVAVLEN